ncbi:hypothetical protein GOBAR_DD13512 [Gossypium barbadense]|nr:hypothetical protein GOBAR_DD13512 [Gossypium barbadense]
MDLAADQIEKTKNSWKDKLIGSSSRSAGFVLESNEDFELLAGNGLPSIKFSDRIQHIHIRDVENTVILKLLGCNIGFSILHNKIYNLWKPSAPFHLMDIENGYFLARLDNKVDCKKYLTVQPWTVSFDLEQKFSSVVMAWIKLPGLLGYMNIHNILMEIVGLVGKVAKLDLNPDNRTKGRFTRLVVYINQDMSLVSHILINGKLQKVEYEFLPTVCCHCGRYDYLKEVCPSRVPEPSSVKQPLPSSTLTEVEKIIVNGSEETGETYEPWMLVESEATGSSSGPDARKTSPIRSYVSEAIGRRQSFVTGVPVSELNVRTGEGEIPDSGSGSFNVDSDSVPELPTKPTFSMLSLVEALVVVSTGGLNPSKHMTTFKVTVPVDDALSEGTKVSDSGAARSMNPGRLMGGKIKSFRAIKKLIKSHGK